MHWKRLLIARPTKSVAIVRKHFVNTMTSNGFILIYPLRMRRRLAEAKNRRLQQKCPRRRKCFSFCGLFGPSASISVPQNRLTSSRKFKNLWAKHRTAACLLATLDIRFWPLTY